MVRRLARRLAQLMTIPPVASIVIPARNAASTLGVQLAALSRQTFEYPYEVIVADNGSLDNTANVAAQWSNQFDNFRIIDATKHPGISYARNAGISAAAGEYILFCDADDEASPDWIRGLIEALQQSDIVGGRLDVTSLNHSRTRAWRRSLSR